MTGDEDKKNWTEKKQQRTASRRASLSGLTIANTKTLVAKVPCPKREPCREEPIDGPAVTAADRSIENACDVQWRVANYGRKRKESNMTASVRPSKICASWS